MLAIKIWNYLKGYVIIRINGLGLERFLNLALVNDIYLWDVKRLNNVEIKGTVSVKGYEDVKKLAEKVGCRIEIVNKKGLPFMMEKIRERKALGLGILVFIILIGFLSSLVWQIEITGTEQIPKKEIIKLLEENNIKVGKLKRSLNKEQIKKILLNKYEYISFLDIKMKGIKLSIELKEQDISPEEIDKSYPCNIIANKKGVITKIIARQGKAVVKKGKIVEEGEVLISGVMSSDESEENYLVHSEGEVLAQTRYTSEVKSPIVARKETETGKIHRQRGVKIGKKGIKFFSGDRPFENYREEIVEKDKLNIKRFKLKLPIKIIEYIYREVEVEEVEQNVEVLKKALQLEAIEKINSELSTDSEIVSKESVNSIDGNMLTTKVIIETIEDIGKVQIISD